MSRRAAGFTLIELTVVVTVLGILIAAGIANYRVMEDRACEVSTKANMHTFQAAAEDYAIQHDAAYAPTADLVAALLPTTGTGFRNPFDRTTGDHNAWVDRASWSVPLTTGSTKRGIVAYCDSAASRYQIAGRGMSGDLPLILLNGY